ncbi:unnamed protein product [Microthlaspi erraticum]|uniref:SWIM-type domain-containing protein n=1 Tax=Microthlaspi erraticum TaxID=1685480 RepID=A0A6D2JWT9_9BRAS|nr:unnamed protein product [Microthlaspi erraticum]
MTKAKRKAVSRKGEEIDDGGDGEPEIDDGGDDEPVIEDDCGVVGDDDCDDVDDGDDEDDENDVNTSGVVEEGCEDLVQHFGEAARDDESGSDADSGDDIWDDEKIPDPMSSDSDDDDEDEEQGQRENDDPDQLLALGKTFNTPEDFKLAVLRYSLKTRYDIKLYKSQAMKIGAKCSDTDVNCGWRVYCSYEKRRHKMQIKVYVNNHTCVRSGYTKMLKRSTIAWLFSERLRKNPHITKQEMAAEIKREYNLVVSDDQCGKAKSKLMRERKASHEAHFARVWDYQAEIFQTNPHTKFEIETIPGPTIGSKARFYRCYVCFSSQRESWKQTCRPIIGLDGAFLKWDIKGHLLAAVGRDGDNRIVPIAWAVVEVENDDNWDWFIKQLSGSLDLGDGRKVSIISDKHKSLVKAVKNVLPQAEHRQCARHIMENWKKDSHDRKLQELFWKIARSYTMGEFTDNMEALARYNPYAFATLQDTNPKSWSRAFFRIGSCCNDNLNNLSESFNRIIRQARKKPLLELLEDIRRQCMVRNAKRAIIAGRLKKRFTVRAHEEIEKMIAGSQFCIRYMARDDFHEVELNNDRYCVDMNTLTCGCKKWQMIGIPCVHAASVIIAKKRKVEDYVNDYYTTRMWQETYRRGIKPVEGMKVWPRLNRLPVLPPPWRKGNPGRPSNYARKKGKNESASKSSKTKLSRALRVMTCSNCKEDGHNKQTCENPFVESQPKRPRGRPKKYQEIHKLMAFHKHKESHKQKQFQNHKESHKQKEFHNHKDFLKHRDFQKEKTELHNHKGLKDKDHKEKEDMELQSHKDLQDTDHKEKEKEFHMLKIKVQKEDGHKDKDLKDKYLKDKDLKVGDHGFDVWSQIFEMYFWHSVL